MTQMIKRIGLLALSSLAIMVSLGIVITILNVVFNVNIMARGDMGSLAVLSVVLGFGSAFIGLLMSRWSAKRAYSIKLLTGNESDSKFQTVYATVYRIAQQHGIKTPEVGYYISKDPNAFATGSNKDSALVAVSTGLLETMSDEAVRGVVGHEMAHILNGDMVTSTLLQGILNTLVIFVARAIAGVVSSDDDGGTNSITYFLIANILDIVLGLGVTLIVMRFSRHREYVADADSAVYLGSKEPMLEGLRALQRMYDPKAKIKNDELATMKISGKIAGLFASHPSLDSRIAALEQSTKR